MLFYLKRTIVFVGDPGAAVCNMNDAAAAETVFLQLMLHDQIIFVGVDTQVAALGFTVIHTFADHTTDHAVTGNPVHGAIRGV